jgi:hypothetical protein
MASVGREVAEDNRNDFGLDALELRRGSSGSQCRNRSENPQEPAHEAEQVACKVSFGETWGRDVYVIMGVTEAGVNVPSGPRVYHRRVSASGCSAKSPEFVKRSYERRQELGADPVAH